MNKLGRQGILFFVIALVGLVLIVGFSFLQVNAAEKVQSEFDEINRNQSKADQIIGLDHV